WDIICSVIVSKFVQAKHYLAEVGQREKTRVLFAFRAVTLRLGLKECGGLLRFWLRRAATQRQGVGVADVRRQSGCLPSQPWIVFHAFEAFGEGLGPRAHLRPVQETQRLRSDGRCG